MERKLISPPDELAVSMVEARIAARADGTMMDTEISRAVRAIAGDAEHEMQRAIIDQEWRLTGDRFPAEIVLPFPPLLSVTSIKYYDTEGVLRTVEPEDYDVNSDTEPATIEPRTGRAWPATQTRRNAVMIQYRCGYGPDDGQVPDGIKYFILAKVQEEFSPVGTPKSPHLCRLLDRYRVYL